MSDSCDIRQLLSQWPYDPENEVRLVNGDDGREIIQVRTPIGIEQLEMQGRPDGKRPHGAESHLDSQLSRLERSRATGREADFELNPRECAELFAEGTLYYLRYLRLFQLRRWKETIRDTERNLKLFDLVHQFASREEDRNNLEKWRPYIIRMQAAASALLHLEKAGYEKADAIVRSAIARIEELPDLNDETFDFERERSLTALRELQDQMQQSRPASDLERLQKQLENAIDLQEFERAAELRDLIRDLKRDE